MPYFRHILPDVPVEISDSTNDIGNSLKFSSADHVHAHGDRGGGTLHAEATTLVAGFLSPSDKIKIDNISGSNSGDITLSGSYDYLTLSGQTLTLGQVDLATDIIGTLPSTSFPALTGAITTTAGSLVTSYNSIVPENKGGTGNSVYTIGDMLYATSTTTLSKLSTNITSNASYLSSSGDGIVGSVPAWSVLPNTNKTIFFLESSFSGDLPSYRTLSTAPTNGTPQSITINSVNNNDVLVSFCTDLNKPNLSYLPEGLLRFRVNASQISGTKVTQLYAEVYKRSSLGVETLLYTTNSSDVLTLTSSLATFDCITTYAKLSLDDRLVFKIRALLTGDGTTPDVVLYLEHSNHSRIELPTQTLIYSSSNDLPLNLYKENSLNNIPSVASGINSVAIGNGATSSATNSTSIGEHSNSRLYGSVAIANGRFSSTGDSQNCKYILRTSTINGLQTEMFLDGTNGSERLVLQDDSTWTFTVTVTAHRTDVGDGHAGFVARGVIYRGSGASNTFIVGNIVHDLLASSNPEWGINIQADTTNGSLKILVTGQSSKTIRWMAVVDTVELTN